MRADADALFLGAHHQAVHNHRVASVKAAGDVGRTDDLQQRRVVADVVGALGVAHLKVGLDPVEHQTGEALS